MLYNGVESRNTHPEKFKKFTIAYTGSLFGEERDPSAFLNYLDQSIADTLMEREDIQFVYAGKDEALMDSYIKKYSLQDVFVNKGVVAREQALEIQQRAHINLLLTSSNPNYQGILTGKFFEYLSSLTPIIANIKGTKDLEFDEIFESTQCGQIVYNNEFQSNAGVLFEAYTHYKNGHPIKTDKKLVDEKFSWENSVLEMLNRIS